MLFSKTRRIQNRKLLDEIKSYPCCICGRRPCDPSHIKTVGSGGDDVPHNVVPMCRDHHIEWGKSWVLFLEKYPKFLELLDYMGWEIFNGKLINESLTLKEKENESGNHSQSSTN